jgi:hypothetical protein
LPDVLQAALCAAATTIFRLWDAAGMNEDRRRKFNLAGWGLFIVSAVFFMLAALRSGDPLGLLGGFFFLVACIVFLVPLLAGRSN